MKKILQLILILFILNQFVTAQSSINDSTGISVFRNWMKFDGTIKTKLETSTIDGVIRFNVRNSRVGIKGDIGKYVSYKVQVELSSEGTLAPLDLYGVLKPIKGLSINFGQTPIPFDNDYIVTPGSMMFSNRSFTGKYFSPGSRDLGVVAMYTTSFFNFFPISGEIALFNGSKMNNPQWTNHPSFAARATFGSMEEGFKTSYKVYQYNNINDTLSKLLLGADVRYATEKLRLEAEVTAKIAQLTHQDLYGTYIQGTYAFDLKKTKIFHSICPIFRWDAMGYEILKSGFDVNRLTFGVNFGLNLKPFISTLRIDYEHYFLATDDFYEFNSFDAHVSDNKITLELVLRF